MFQVDLEQADWDILMYDKKERMCQNEIDNFVRMIRDLVPNIDDLKNYAKHDELQERNYWITRMAKQAAMDINTIGRISQGNMDSILMMPLADVQESISLAVKYNLALGKGIDAIGQNAVAQLQSAEGKINYIDAFVNEQLKLEEKTQGENL